MAKAAGARFVEGPFLDFLDPWGNRLEITEYSNIQYSKAPNVMRGMGLALDKNDKAKKELGDKGMTEMGTMGDLSSNAIVDRGRVVGLWEYDHAAAPIAWTALVKPSAALTAEVARTEAFIRADLGDARTFSLDSPESRLPRIRAIRQASA